MMLLWLTVVWLGLWGSLSWANALGGVVLGAVLLRLLPMEAPDGADRVSPTGLLRFAGVFLVALVRSSVQVFVQVLRPGRPLYPAILAVSVRGGGNRMLTVVANSISLTPGTLTLEVDRHRRVLHVHVLDVGADGAGIPGVRAGIERLEAAAGRALGVHP